MKRCAKVQLGQLNDMLIHNETLRMTRKKMLRISWIVWKRFKICRGNISKINFYIILFNIFRNVFRFHMLKKTRLNKMLNSEINENLIQKHRLIWKVNSRKLIRRYNCNASGTRHQKVILFAIIFLSVWLGACGYDRKGAITNLRISFSFI